MGWGAVSHRVNCVGRLATWPVLSCLRGDAAPALQAVARTMATNVTSGSSSSGSSGRTAVEQQQCGDAPMNMLL